MSKDFTTVRGRVTLAQDIPREERDAPLLCDDIEDPNPNQPPRPLPEAQQKARDDALMRWSIEREVNEWDRWRPGWADWYYGR